MEGNKIINRKITLTLLFTLLFLFQSVFIVAAEGQSSPFFTIEKKVDFKAFEEWYDKNFDSYRESSTEFKTNKEIADELAKLQVANSEDGVSLAWSGFYIGDVLVTDENKTSGWNHGHAALVQDSRYTIEILGFGDVLTSNRSLDSHWTNKYSSKAHLRTVVYSDLQARMAKDWLKSYADNNTITYSLIYKVNENTTKTTYCSKAVWQGWYYGAGIQLVSPSWDIVTPKMLYTTQNLKIMSSTISKW